MSIKFRLGKINISAIIGRDILRIKDDKNGTKL